MKLYEKEVISYLNIPSIPRKEWDGHRSFKDGVALLQTKWGEEVYGVCTFDNEKDSAPRVKKVFGQESFKDILKIFPVPNYMDIDISHADLDETSLKKASMLVDEIKEIEGEEESEESALLNSPKNEYYFDNITNDEEARAFITAYNRTNRIKGKVPQKHEHILMRLAVIYSDENKKMKK